MRGEHEVRERLRLSVLQKHVYPCFSNVDRTKLDLALLIINPPLMSFQNEIRNCRELARRPFEFSFEQNRQPL